MSIRIKHPTKNTSKTSHKGLPEKTPSRYISILPLKKMKLKQSTPEPNSYTYKSPPDKNLIKHKTKQKNITK